MISTCHMPFLNFLCSNTIISSFPSVFHAKKCDVFLHFIIEVLKIKVISKQPAKSLIFQKCFRTEVLPAPKDADPPHPEMSPLPVSTDVPPTARLSPFSSLL